jgi:hypothetical protein
MPSILPSEVVAYTDKLCAWYLQVQSGLGDGTSGASAKVQDMMNVLLNCLSYDELDALLRPTKSLLDASIFTNFVSGTVPVFLSALSNLCGRSGLSGVSDLNTYATYYNLQDATKWQCLFNPVFRSVYALWRGGAYPSAYNVYFEVLQGSQYPNGLRKLVVGTGQTAGYTIDDTMYAGGYAYVTWSGVSGSGTATVTGTWRKTDGTTATGNGTANISGASGSATITPPFSNALILSCSNISVGGITAGTLYVEARSPSGRTNPPS